MSDPVRLLDLGDDELRARVLGSSRSDAPSEAGRRRTAAALGLLPHAAAAAAAPGGAKTLVLLAKWFGIGLFGGFASMGVVEGARALLSHPPSPPGAAAVAPPPPAPATAPLPSALPVASAESAPLPAAPSATSAATPPPSAAPSGKPRGSLAEELQMVDAARAALAAGDAARALTLLDRYDAAYPRARFADESTTLRIEALLRLGQRARAVALARTFLRQHPESALSGRVKSLTGLDSAP